jgi:hypothetical protein
MVVIADASSVHFRGLPNDGRHSNSVVGALLVTVRRASVNHPTKKKLLRRSVPNSRRFGPVFHAV